MGVQLISFDRPGYGESDRLEGRRDAEFRASHQPLGGEKWLRTGMFTAWQVSETQILRTIEGRAIARAGDWVVEGRAGERWPVTDEQFRRTYRAGNGHPATLGRPQDSP